MVGRVRREEPNPDWIWGRKHKKKENPTLLKYRNCTLRPRALWGSDGERGSRKHVPSR